MAVKKSKPAETAAKKAPSKKPATKPKKAPAATAKAKATTPAVAPETSVKAAAPKKAAATKAAPKKAAPVVKLTESQLKFLKQIQDAKEGFLTAKKAELKTIEALLGKKLVKKGAKDKASGNFRYTVSKAGEKHLSTQPAV